MPDINCAFSVWNDVRRPRCEELIRRSKRQGIMLDLTKDHGFEQGIEDLLDDLNDNEKWVWEVDLQKMLEDSILMLEKRKEDVYPSVFEL